MEDENFIKKSERELASAIHRALVREEKANRLREKILKIQKESADNAD